MGSSSVAASETALAAKAAVSKGTTTALRRFAAGMLVAGIWGRGDATDAAVAQRPQQQQRKAAAAAAAAAERGPREWLLPIKQRRTKKQKDEIIKTTKGMPPPPPPPPAEASSKLILPRWINKSTNILITQVLLPSVIAVYAVYPMASLLLFRLPEHFSWMGLFQNFHQCWATTTVHRNWMSCVKLYAAHAAMFAPGLSGLWLWRYNHSLSTSAKQRITAISLILGMALFKLSVDHFLLFHLPSDDETTVVDVEGSTPKVAVITGANRGIGFATALALAERGVHVVVTCRSLAKCQPVVDQIERTTAGGSARAAVLDLTSLESAARLAEQLSNDYPEIHFFFANAGTTPQYELTKEGLEDGFGGMHLAHMAVILGILPNLARGGDTKHPSRVVMVSSEMSINAAMGIFGNDLIFSSSNNTTTSTTANTTLEEDLLDDWRGERTRGDGTIGPSLAAYGRAKLCGVLFAFELNRRLARQGVPVISHAVHTGAVVTDSSRNSILRAFPSWIPGLQWVIGQVYFPILWRTVQGGARSLLCPALSQAPHILKGGQYLDALCQPFFHDRDPNLSREQETLIKIPSFLFGEKSTTTSEGTAPPTTLQVDPIQAVLLADVRWSERLWNVSLAFLEESPARSVIEFAP